MPADSPGFLACLDGPCISGTDRHGRLDRQDILIESWRPTGAYLAGCNTMTTRKAYGSALRSFLRCGPLLELDQVTETAILAYKATLVQAGLSPRTIRQRLIILESFFDWCIERGHHRGPNPVARVPLPSTGKAIAGVALSQADLNQLYGHARTNRDGCILRFLAQGGLRAAELCALQQRDVHSDREYVSIHVRAGKGGKPRHVEIGSYCADKLAVYLAERRWIGPMSPLFQTHRVAGRPLSYSAVYWIVVSAARRARLGHVTPHDLRRTYCTIELKLGTPLPTVQKQMGHAAMEQTARYYRE